MKVRINGVFGKYNNEIDLSNRCTIFIGENGIGKTTTLRILDCILKKDFFNILKYDFKNIQIDDITINYEELIPEKDLFIKVIYKSVKDEYMEIYGDNYELYLEQNSLFDSFRLLLSELSNDEYLKLFRESIFYKDFSSDLVTKVNGCCYQPEIFGFIDGIRKLSEVFRCYLKKINIKDEVEFYQLEKYEKIKNILLERSFILNMVKEYQIIDRYDKIKFVSNRYESKIKKNYLEVLTKFEKENEGLSMLEKKIPFGLKRKVYLSEYKNIKIDKIIKSSVNSCNKNFNYDVFYDVEKNDTINIPKLLFSKYFTKDAIESFVDSYYKYIYGIIDGKVIEQKDLRYNQNFFNGEGNKIKIESYIEPIIPKNSLLDVDISNVNYDFERVLDDYREFIKDNFGKIKNIDNSKINILNTLFNKYFKNKHINITPSKLIISNSENFSDDIGFNFLSAGEQKLIIIFLISVLCDNIILLLDEPEVSLSIVWQEDLIPDLLKYTNLKNIIVATQSPSIIHSDELLDSIIGLPMGE